MSDQSQSQKVQETFAPTEALAGSAVASGPVVAHVAPVVHGQKPGNVELTSLVPPTTVIQSSVPQPAVGTATVVGAVPQVVPQRSYGASVVDDSKQA